MKEAIILTITLSMMSLTFLSKQMKKVKVKK